MNPVERVMMWWGNVQERPPLKRHVYWALACAAGAIASMVLVGVLEEYYGRATAIAFLSRLISGPSYVVWQNGLRLDWVIWEGIMLYSAIQWILLWGAGAAILSAFPGLTYRTLITATYVTVCLTGLIFARSPADSLELFRALL